MAFCIRSLSHDSAESQRNALTAPLWWLHIVLGLDRPLAGSFSHDILLSVERQQHTSALMSKWLGLEDEAMTGETQTPGWGGTKQECCQDGGGVNAVPELMICGSLQRIKTIGRHSDKKN